VRLCDAAHPDLHAATKVQQDSRTSTVGLTICGGAGFLCIPVAFVLGIVALFVDRRKAFAVVATILAVVNGPVMYVAAHLLD